jgi:hypothetical protein
MLACPPLRMDSKDASLYSIIDGTKFGLRGKNSEQKLRPIRARTRIAKNFLTISVCITVPA